MSTVPQKHLNTFNLLSEYIEVNTGLKPKQHFNKSSKSAAFYIPNTTCRAATLVIKKNGTLELVFKKSLVPAGAARRISTKKAEEVYSYFLGLKQNLMNSMYDFILRFWFESEEWEIKAAEKNFDKLMEEPQ